MATLTQRIVWTALPTGVRRVGSVDVVTLGVHVAPRLKGAATLEPFLDFRDWPATLEDYSFKVVMSGASTPITPMAVTIHTDPAAWTTLFPLSTTVDDYSFKDLSVKGISTYPVSKIAGKILHSYADFVSNPLAAAVPPTTKSLADVAVPYIDPADLPSRWRTSKNAVPKRDPDVTKMQKFLQPSGQKYGDKKTIVPPSPDFHQAVGALGKYPSLLPVFGLVLTVEFAKPASAPANGWVRVIPHRETTPPEEGGNTTARLEVAPYTRYELKAYPSSTSSYYFRAAPKTGSTEIMGGRMMMRLSPSAELITATYNRPVSTVQVDVEGASHKLEASGKALVGALASASGMIGGGPVKDTPGRSTLPSLVTTGIQLIRNNRGAKLKVQLAASKGFAAQEALAPPADGSPLGAGIRLYAEDVTRGWAVDVWDSSSGRWHELCAREAAYAVGADLSYPDADGVYREEGFVTSVVTEPVTKPGDPAPTAINVHEALFTWDGWSLVVKRPGAAILAVAADLSSPVGTEVTDEYGTYPIGGYVDPAFHLTAHFNVPSGSLPRLRFGTTYRLRARAVDLAGGAERFNSAAGAPSPTDRTVTEPLVYRRYEPVSPPPLVPTAGYGTGESAYHLVLYSDISDPIGEVPTTSRHVLPPRTAPNVAEKHGGFDQADHSLDPSVYELIATREQAARAFWPSDGPDAAPVDAFPDPVPYLPDPAGAGAAFWNLPGTPAATGDTPINAVDDGARFAGLTVTGVGNLTATQVDFDRSGTAWYDKRPFRLVANPVGSSDKRVLAFTGGDDIFGASKIDPAKWDNAARTLTVSVPRGEQVTVTMSTYTDTMRFDPRRVAWSLRMHGIFDLAVKRLVGHAATLKIVERLTHIGANWMISPFQIVKLTHATRRPIIPPKFNAPKAAKSAAGQTWADFSDYEQVHGPSTSKVDVYAHWYDVVDEPPGAPKDGRDGRGLVERDAHAFEVAVRPDQKIVLDPRWAIQGPKPIVIAEKPLPKPTAAQALAIAQLTLQQRHYIGDTKYRMIDYRTVFTSRYRDYFTSGAPGVAVPADPFTSTSGDGGGEVRKSLKVLSSARPDAPALRWIVPSFAWTREEASDKSRYRSVRGGGGLRVYLDRPWYSSGNDELLGVVFWTPAQTGFLKVEPYISFAAHDPVWKAGHAPQWLLKTDFGAATAHGTKVLLQEVAMSVNVAGHKVTYDAERDLYFADLAIEPHGDYFPMIRLALCRFQPNSLKNCEISRIVMADFVQLTPKRTANLVYSNDTTAVLTVSGVTYQSSSLKHYSHLVVPPTTGDSAVVSVTLEQTSAISDEPSGWTVVSGPAWLTRPTAWVNPLTWTTALQLPPSRAEGQYRLVIREYERVTMTSANPAWDVEGPAGKRLVYAETIPVKSAGLLY